MTDTAKEPLEAPRSRRLAIAVALLLATAFGVFAGTRWHEAFERWLPAHSHDDVSPVASRESPQLWTCGMHPQVIQDQPGLCPICHMELTPLETNGAPVDDNAITIDPAVVQNMGVKTAIVTEDALHRNVRSFGTIEAAEPNVHEVNLLVTGWIRRLYADTEGMRVEKHAPLFDLYSPELHAAIEESIRARRSAPSSDPASDAGGGRRSLYSASLRRLELWGLSSAQAQRLSKLERAPRSVTFTSPIAGVLTEKNIVEGSAVQAGDAALRITDLRVVWIEAKLFEQHVGAVAVGQSVTATVTAFPGETFPGKVVFVDPYVESKTRTIVVRFAVDNAALRLRPGMYASVELALILAEKAMVVPRESVIDTGTRKVAFVALGAGRFEPREIETGVADGTGRIQVLSGLKLGEAVVTSGQFLLDSESRLREAVKKFMRERESVAADAESPPPQEPAASLKEQPRSTPPAAAKSSSDTAPTPAPHSVIYTCPMHPEVRQDAPGQCPICGMDLVPSQDER